MTRIELTIATGLKTFVPARKQLLASLAALCCLFVIVPATAQDAPTQIKFITGNYDCWGARDTTEYAINGTVVASGIQLNNGCACNTNPLQVTLSDAATLAAIGDQSCNELTFSHVGGGANINYVRAEISRPSGIEVVCVKEANNTGGCVDTNACTNSDYDTDQTYVGGPPDIDGDGLNACDDPDLDNDGVLNNADNCPLVVNADQTDTNFDGVGNVCDDFDNDSDNDGIDDYMDNCPVYVRTTFTKPDGPGTGDSDEISANLQIARNQNGALYNLGSDSIAWAAGTCDSPTSAFYSNHSQLLQNNFRNPNPPGVSGNLPNSDTCLRNSTTGEEYDVRFLSWSSQGAGGFSYERYQKVPGNPDQTDTDGNGLGDVCDPPDRDGDGILNINDNCPDTAPADQTDTDSNGLGDVCDPPDRDNDGVLNINDNCPDAANPDQADTNGNGPGDACDPFDRDNDTIWNEDDNCPDHTNPLQTDTDADGAGDACDTTSGDWDLDGVPDAGDNCPYLSNAEQIDTDSDGIGDACDATSGDDDLDGVPDGADNCPTTANANQLDADGDGTGDVCDASSGDLDLDGLADGVDNCPLVFNPDQTDVNADGTGDACAAVLIMPKRDARMGVPVVVWGVTTLNNGDAFTLDYGDGSMPESGTVADRSYIAFEHTYGTEGTFTATLSVEGFSASTEVQVFDVDNLIGGPTGDANRSLGINMSIEDGLRYLWTSQNSRATNFPDNAQTSWGGRASSSETALVTLAFQNHGYSLGNDLQGLYERFIVQRALNYVISSQTTIGLGVTPNGYDACVATPSGDRCTGLFDQRYDTFHQSYTTAVAVLPLAASGALGRVVSQGDVAGNYSSDYVVGKTYGEILQRMVNALAWGQVDANGNARGGWYYDFNRTSSDGSTIGWDILAMLDAAAAGAVVPSWVPAEFANAFGNHLNNDGSLDYPADGNPDQNSSVGPQKNGIGLQGLYWLGETGGARVDAVVANINSWWPGADPYGIGGNNWGGPDNHGSAYAMFNFFKGLKLIGVTTLEDVNRSERSWAFLGAPAEDDWYADYQDWFVANQISPETASGGGWGQGNSNMQFSCCLDGGPINAAIAELILSPVALVLPDGDAFSEFGLSPETDTAPEGDDHTVTAKAESTGGTPVPGATVNFEVLTGPNAGATSSDVTNALGEATFTYTDASIDGGLDTIQATIGNLESNVVEMNWTPVNDAPDAVNDSDTTDEDMAVTTSVLDNDSDLEGDSISVTASTDGANGTVSCTATDCTYTPALDFNGSDSYTYTISDGLLTDMATVTITVDAVNDAPDAVDDSDTTDEDDSVTTGVLLNDSDVEGDSISITASTDGANGTVSCTATDCTYTPALNFNGGDSYTYTISDGLLSDTAKVTITVRPVNDAPVAVDDSDDTDEDVAVTTDVLANDDDIDGDSLTVSVVTNPSNGSVSCTAAGCTYTPDANFNGVDAYKYKLSDGSLDSNIAKVTITVRPVNDAPVAADDSDDTDEDVAVTTNVLANDDDVEGDSLTVSVVTNPSNGSVSCTAAGCTYTPDANFNGVDAYKYKLSDGSLDSNIAKVTITVRPVNDAPVAADDSDDTDEDVAVTTDVLANDDDIDGDSLTVSVVTNPSNGAVNCTAAGCTYTPDANFNGVDAYKYKLSDGSLDSNIAKVTITVRPVNDAPVAADDSDDTDEDVAVTTNVLANDDDVEGDSLTVSVVTNPSNGTVNCTAAGCEYTPAINYNGADSYSYRVFDGELYSNTATVTITVNPVNDAPVAADDSDETNEDVAVTTDVLANDDDVDGDSLTVSVVSNPSNGTVNCTVAGCEYTPAINYNGADSYSYRVFDGELYSNVATVAITVIPVNDAPVAADDSDETNEDVAVTTDVLANDDDVDGDSLTVSVVSNPSNGTVNCTVAGCEYTPAINYNGADSYSYRVFDGELYSNVATVAITVIPVNDAPVAADDSDVTNEDDPVTTDVLANDDDVEGDSLTVSVVSNPSNGTVSCTAAGCTYTPAINFNGADSYSYRVFDGELYSNTATVTITVNAVNDAPVAADDTAATLEDTPVMTDVLTNDTDLDGDGIAVVGSTNGSNGGVSCSANDCTYTPAPNFNGMDSYTYTMCDNGTPQLCDTASVSVTIVPVNDAPVALCQDVEVAANAMCEAPANVDNGSSDPVEGSDITLVQDPLSPYPLGINPVTLTVSDGQLSDSCQAVVNVFDNTDPVINTCASDKIYIIEADGQILLPDLTGEVVAEDNCSVSILQAPAANSALGAGGYTVTYTAEDTFGNTDTCTSVVTVLERSEWGQDEVKVHFHGHNDGDSDSGSDSDSDSDSDSASDGVPTLHCLTKLELDGELFLRDSAMIPMDVRGPGELLVTARVVVTMADVLVSDESFQLEVKDDDDEKWEFKRDGSEPDDATDKLKIDWTDTSEYDSHNGSGLGDDVPQIETRFIGFSETEMKLEFKDVARPFTMTFSDGGTDHVITIEDDDGTVTTAGSYDMKSKKDSLEITLPFRLTPETTISVSGGASLEYPVNTDTNYVVAGAKYMLDFDRTPLSDAACVDLSLTAQSDPKLEVEIHLGEGVQGDGNPGEEVVGGISLGPDVNDWTKLDNKHWENKP